MYWTIITLRTYLSMTGSFVYSFAIGELHDMLIKKYEKVIVTWGLKDSHLGMIMTFSTTGWASISIPGFIGELIKDYGATTTATTSPDENLFTLRPSPPLANETKKFHSLVAILLYLNMRTRPDILTLVALLNTRVQLPTEEDRAKLDKGMKYITETAADKLILRMRHGTCRCLSRDTFGHAQSQRGVYHPRPGRNLLQVIETEPDNEKFHRGGARGQCWCPRSDDLVQALPTSSGTSDLISSHLGVNESITSLAKTGRSCSERARHIDFR